MATTKDQIKSNYPLPVYNYKVDIGDITVAFSEITGLEAKIETITYKESVVSGGKSGPETFYMPGQQSPINISLKKGFVKGKSVPVLYGWFSSIELNRVEKKDITIHLLDEKGETVVSWKAIDAFPTKITAPAFNAKSNEVAVESMDLMASALIIKEA